MGIFSYLRSTILSKVVMAVTGAILVLYLIIHTAGNLLIYFGRDTLNSYSAFLHSLGPILWIFRVVLIVSVVLHIITSIKLKFENWNAKPTGYALKHYLKARFSSRTMIWTGIMIFAFVLYHLLHFTFRVTNPQHYSAEFFQMHNAVSTVILERFDVYKMVVLGFKNPLISLVYIVGVIIVGFHLDHAIQSMFQTLGFNEKHYFPTLQNLSTILSIIIVICLISIPISIMSGLVGGEI
ncbi:MAG: succinate dehydrogenase cytochrome b subunit [Ignavibacteria bacterium]|nr:succinate dehydrogenase cytochrome b subunit [Ignavibacteria bacterium]